ncbi:MAG TPA: HD domain-containing phosphohydrolase [Bacillota bacterium]|nr:HD domain-containing phosphohydrolase [Bacillota bacterium]
MKILIVEDEYVSRKKLELLLNNLGFETIVADNGVMGWNLWRNERPRILITDWMMPEMDGIELCKKIRLAEGSQYTYIIMVTSKNDTHDLVESMDAGADDFITKPYIKEELLVRIRSGKRILDFESRDVTIFAISKLAESRDPETGNHLERIRFYAKVLAETLVKSENPPPEIDALFIDNIFLTSPLHDIGKIGIPDYILLKPGRLDDKEFNIMKNHTVVGYNTLNAAAKRDLRAEYLQMSAAIALSHHEKYDGSGYPEGLKGEAIPLAARIVALADVYDALVSKRVYKEAMSHDIAKSIIIKSRGEHFDPMIVDAFLEAEDKFIKIYHRYIGD